MVIVGVLLGGILSPLALFGFTMNKPARLEINIGNHRRVFEGRAVNNMTILDALNASSAAGNISLKYVLDPLNDEAKILSLDGYNSESNSALLAFYLNSQKVRTEKIHSIHIKSGDVILVKTE